ncbi:MGMT family protein [Lolliginicoccus suaedae]|uniref:MGMT family protein n=1 Tax=Lolliginicoccus suaedae TaxID=2605429 RepID=UPI0011F0138E|nr:MGMT family protein [Lolliginicoccus suaedae]
MPALEDADVERVRALIRSVPSGHVTTYGDVARAAGLGNARMVGWILRTDGADLPWHRVVRADGSLAPHLATEQALRLQAENVTVSGHRVLLRPLRHVFPA